MILLALTSYLHIQLSHAENFHSVSYEQTAISLLTEEKSFYASDIPNYYYQPTWNGRLSAENFDTYDEKQEFATYQASAQKVLSILPNDHSNSLENLIVKNESHPSRGMANGSKLILNTGRIDDQQEFMAVMIHEMGHVVDLGKFVSQKKQQKSAFTDFGHPVYQDDLSVQFYSIAWSNETKIKSYINLNRDFVSGYASSDPFEDFAETYLYYRLHGADFRQRMAQSSVLKQKYNFMKLRVFNGEEFQLHGNTHQTEEWIYDATLLPYENGF